MRGMSSKWPETHWSMSDEVHVTHVAKSICCQCTDKDCAKGRDGLSKVLEPIPDVK